MPWRFINSVNNLKPTMTRLKLLLPLTASILLAACAGNSGRYTMKDDRPPADAPDVSKVEDAHPRFEPYSKQGNKDYQSEASPTR